MSRKNFEIRLALDLPGPLIDSRIVTMKHLVPVREGVVRVRTFEGDVRVM